MSFAAKIWGALAASIHNTRPGVIDMATVAKLATKGQPQVESLAWFDKACERGRSGIVTERVLVTPGLAAGILLRNPDNRNISPTKAQHYATDMAHGRWQENGETIIVSSDGLLNDGQHRLQAVIDANAIVPFTFVFGVSRESRLTVDQGRARSAGDYLSMQGCHYAKNAATAAKFIIAYERSDGKNISARADITNGEIVARVSADDDIVTSAAFAHKHLKEYRSLFSHTVMAACHYILSEIHPGEAETFLTTVALGENIKRGDPAFAVRQAFMSDKRERQDAMEVILRGWNGYRQGTQMKSAKVYRVFPALI